MQTKIAKQTGALDRLKVRYGDVRKEMLEKKNQFRINEMSMSDTDKDDLKLTIKHHEDHLTQMLKEIGILIGKIGGPAFKP